MKRGESRRWALSLAAVLVLGGGATSFMGVGQRWSPSMLLGGPQDSPLSQPSTSDPARDRADLEQLERCLRAHGNRDVSWTTVSGEPGGAFVALGAKGGIELTTEMHLTTDPSGRSAGASRYLTMVDNNLDGVVDEIAIVAPDGNVQRFTHPTDAGFRAHWEMTLAAVLKRSAGCDAR